MKDTLVKMGLRSQVADLTPAQLEDVITGRTRLGSTPEQQLAAWNMAIDRANGYDE